MVVNDVEMARIERSLKVGFLENIEIFLRFMIVLRRFNKVLVVILIVTHAQVKDTEKPRGYLQGFIEEPGIIHNNFRRGQNSSECGGNQLWDFPYFSFFK